MLRHSPAPKNRDQRRLTTTRAVNSPTPPSAAGVISQRARSPRVARPDVDSVPRKLGTAGCTTSPLSSIQLPRGRTRTSRGVGNGCVTINVRDNASRCCVSASSEGVSWPAGASDRVPSATAASSRAASSRSKGLTTRCSGKRVVGRVLVPPPKPPFPRCRSSSMSAKKAPIA